jgi:hypothetical protein
MFTTAVNGTSTCLFVGGTPGSLQQLAIEHEQSYWLNLQPVKFLVMGKLENKLIDYLVDSQSPTDKLQIGIIRVIEDEIVPIEICQGVTANSTGKL